MEAPIRFQLLDLHSFPIAPSPRTPRNPQNRGDEPPQQPALLLSQDPAAAAAVATAARHEQIPLDVCPDVTQAREMALQKRYRAVLADLDVPGSRELFSDFAGQEMKPIGVAMLTAPGSLSHAFAAGFTLAIHKPLSLRPVRMGLKAAYEFGQQGRRTPRADVGFPAAVGIAGDGVVRGSMLNLSEEGACLALGQAVNTGTRMTVRFALPGAAAFDIGAMVVWDGGGRAGVRFHRMPCRHRAGIGAWVWGVRAVPNPGRFDLLRSRH